MQPGHLGIRLSGAAPHPKPVSSCSAWELAQLHDQLQVSMGISTAPRLAAGQGVQIVRQVVGVVQRPALSLLWEASDSCNSARVGWRCHAGTGP